MSPAAPTRRRLLGGAAVAVVAAAVPAVGLAACSGADSPASTGTSDPTAAPSPTGLLRVALAGGAAPSLDPRRAGPGADRTALLHLYDSLVALSGGEYRWQLAEAVEPDATATTWTIRVRDGVSFSNGKPLGAADVIYSLRTLAAPLTSPSFAPFYSDLDLDGLRELDARTVVAPLRRPRGDFVESMLSPFSLVFPEGTTDFTVPVGSGPYRLTSYAPGQEVQLAANPDYWDGRPTVDAVTLLTIGAPEARMRALRDGQADYAAGITPTAARAADQDGSVEVHRGGAANSNALVFAFDQTAQPYDDPGVRRALRAVVDRQALVDAALFGQGVTGEDVVGKGLPGYAAGLDPRQQTPPAEGLARAAAGGLRLRAADYVPGLLDASRLAVRQWGEAGIDVAMDETTPAAVFADLNGLRSTPFQAFYYVNRPAPVHLGLNTTTTARFNLGGYGEQWEARLTAAQSTVDGDVRQSRFDDLQHALHEDGAEIVWAFQEQLDASVPGVAGVELVQSVPVLTRAGRR